MELNNFKNALNESDVSLAANILTELYIENPDKFKKSLLLSNSLPEPLGRSFTDKKLETLQLALILAGEQLIEKGIHILNFTRDFAQLTQTIEIISKNAKSNQERLLSCDFFNYSLSEQLQMFCIYIEDQYRLSTETRTNNKNFITGMESEVAKFDADNVKGVKISETDRHETLIEIADTLFRLLYHNGKKTIENEVNFEHENITPYEIGSFEEIIYLALQRNLLVDMWGKFKYRDWELKVIEKNGITHQLFIPCIKEDYKKERIAINRYIYQDHININQQHRRNLKANNKSANYINELSNGLDVTNIQALFQLEKNSFFKANVIFKNSINGQLKTLDTIYYDIDYRGIKLIDLIKGFEYLTTIAFIYQEAVSKTFDQDEVSHYKMLSPILEKESLIEQFSHLFDMDYVIAQKVINILTFSDTPLLDVFSQPLIYAGRNKVIFCPTLILQMHFKRIIEMLATELKIDVSKKGTDFEKELRFILSFNPCIQVNTNKIEFKAYDNKDVEFDFIGLFNDHLLLIEFKHLRIPYSDKTKKNALDNIDFGIEQVNRREKILKHDWEKIKEQCSFGLPNEPPEKVIKLVCTNIFDFSTIIREGVEIIDSSSLLKFFMSPEIKGTSLGSEINEVVIQKLWKEDYPSVEEFKSFLECPVAIQPLVNCFEEGAKPIAKIKNNDYNINFFDYSLVKDPFENIDPEIFESKSTIKKVGRNAPCPCQSGKKHKKCCGA